MARYVDADYLLNTLSDDLPYKSSVKRVLICAPTVDVAKKIFYRINERLDEAEHEMEEFIETCNDGDACADCEDRLDGLRYAIALMDEIQSEFGED